MLGNHKIIVDEWAEVWDLLKPHADGSFWQWCTLWAELYSKNTGMP